MHLLKHNAHSVGCWFLNAYRAIIRAHAIKIMIWIVFDVFIKCAACCFFAEVACVSSSRCDIFRFGKVICALHSENNHLWQLAELSFNFAANTDDLSWFSIRISFRSQRFSFVQKIFIRSKDALLIDAYFIYVKRILQPITHSLAGAVNNLIGLFGVFLFIETFSSTFHFKRNPIGGRFN